MHNSKAVEAVKFLGRCLKEKGLKISKIILFGSQLEVKTTEESDVDVVIISEDFRDKDIFDRARLTKEAKIKTLKKFMIPIDIITLTSEDFESKTSIVAEYARKGKVAWQDYNQTI